MIIFYQFCICCVFSITFMQKSEDPTQKGNYRQMSLMSTDAKVFSEGQPSQTQHWKTWSSTWKWDRFRDADCSASTSQHTRDATPMGAAIATIRPSQQMRESIDRIHLEKDGFWRNVPACDQPAAKIMLQGFGGVLFELWNKAEVSTFMQSRYQKS